MFKIFKKMGKITDMVKMALIGKKLCHTNQHGRTVELVVEDVISNSRYVQITPDTKENDWWGEGYYVNNTKIVFVDGSSIDVEDEYEIV